MYRKNTDVENKAYKFRVYPNGKQIEMINKTFGCVRFIYNHLLFDKSEYYKAEKKPLKREVSYYKKQEEFSFLKEVDSLALSNAKLNLDVAFKNFFSKNAKYPTFHKKGINNSYTTNMVNNNIKKTEKGIILPKVGEIKTKFHRQIGKNEIIKSCTVSRKDGKYYISVLTEKPKETVIPVDITTIPDNRIIGFDYSVPHFYVDSNNNQPDYHNWYRNSERKLAKEYRKLSRKVYKSNNYYKQLAKIQKISNHISNQRLDFCHKLSRKLVSQYDVFCFEDINLSALKRTLNLGKSVSDTGFGMFRTMIKYKAEKEGKYFIKVDKWYASTKICSYCGYKNDFITLKADEWTCPQCGTHHLRDYNAAINIKEEGKRILYKQLKDA